MKPLNIVLWLVAISQFVLGGLCIGLPGPFYNAMGLTVPSPDNQYMIAMLGARFVAYGVGMIYLSRQTEPSRFWIRNMVLIQIIDLAAGLFYTANGTVGLNVTGFPMFNAAMFIALLVWFMPKARDGGLATAR